MERNIVGEDEAEERYRERRGIGVSRNLRMLLFSFYLKFLERVSILSLKSFKKKSLILGFTLFRLQFIFFEFLYIIFKIFVLSWFAVQFLCVAFFVVCFLLFFFFFRRIGFRSDVLSTV